MNRKVAYAMVQAIAVQQNIMRLEGRLLDVGCGSKPYKRLHSNVTEWLGMDIRPVGEIEADMQEMPFADESFNSVLCTDSLQYALDPVAVIGEISRVLKPGGVLLLTCPNVSEEDEVTCFNFKMKWLTTALPTLGLDIEKADTASKMWEYEFANYTGTSKYGVPMPGDIAQFTGFLDTTFPALNIIVATKRESAS